MATAAGKNKDNLVWIDCEMTGLEPDRHVILEVAAVVTDKDLNALETTPNLVIHHSAKALASISAWSAKQHAASGLLRECDASRRTTKHVEAELIRFVRKFCQPGCAPLCGNSVGHDRAFLSRHMPRLNAYLHYRNIDVSTIKELVRRWCPKSCQFPPKMGSHRAACDIMESIAELRHYRAKFFGGKVVGAADGPGGRHRCESKRRA